MTTCKQHNTMSGRNLAFYLSTRPLFEVLQKVSVRWSKTQGFGDNTSSDQHHDNNIMTPCKQHSTMLQRNLAFYFSAHPPFEVLQKVGVCWSKTQCFGETTFCDQHRINNIMTTCKQHNTMSRRNLAFYLSARPLCQGLQKVGVRWSKTQGSGEKYFLLSTSRQPYHDNMQTA